MPAHENLDRFLDSQGIPHSPPTAGTTVGSPCGHGHVDGSNHYPQSCGGPIGSTGQARDHTLFAWITGVGVVRYDLARIFRAFEPYARGPNYILSELFYDPLGAYKRGVRIPAIGGHSDHVHDALAVGRYLPILGDTVTDQEIQAIAERVVARLQPNQLGYDLGDVVNAAAKGAADLVMARLRFGSADHTNLGDVVNETVRQVTDRFEAAGVLPPHP